MASSLASRLLDALGPDVVRVEPEDLAVYGFDAYSESRLPTAAIVPRDAREVAIAVRIAAECGEPVVPRGAGTGLCGGAVPTRGGLVISFARMNRILELDVGEPARARAARTDQPRPVAGGGAARRLLRARSVEPEDLDARRQRRHERRRPALSELRHDDESRARRRVRRRGRRGAADVARRSGLRPHRRARRLRRDARRRDGDRRAAAAHPRSGARVRRRVRRRGVRLRSGLGDHRRGDRADRARDHGCADHPRRRGALSRGLSGERRRGAARRARRRAGRRRGGRSGADEDRTRARRALLARRARRGRARRAVGGAQGRRRRDRPHRAELLHPRRVRPAHAAAGGDARDRRDRARASLAGRQRLPRRRRQPAPAADLRPSRQAPGAGRRRGRDVDPRDVHRDGRDDQRRARDRSREARDALARLQQRRSGRDGPRPRRVRSCAASSIPTRSSRAARCAAKSAPASPRAAHDRTQAEAGVVRARRALHRRGRSSPRTAPRRRWRSATRRAPAKRSSRTAAGRCSRRPTRRRATTSRC